MMERQVTGRLEEVTVARSCVWLVEEKETHIETRFHVDVVYGARLRQNQWIGVKGDVDDRELAKGYIKTLVAPTESITVNYPTEMHNVLINPTVLNKLEEQSKAVVMFSPGHRGELRILGGDTLSVTLALSAIEDLINMYLQEQTSDTGTASFLSPSHRAKKRLNKELRRFSLDDSIIIISEEEFTYMNNAVKRTILGWLQENQDPQSQTPRRVTDARPRGVVPESPDVIIVDTDLEDTIVQQPGSANVSLSAMLQDSFHTPVNSPGGGSSTCVKQSQSDTAGVTETDPPCEPRNLLTCLAEETPQKTHSGPVTRSARSSLKALDGPGTQSERTPLKVLNGPRTRSARSPLKDLNGPAKQARKHTTEEVVHCGSTSDLKGSKRQKLGQQTCEKQRSSVEKSIADENLPAGDDAVASKNTQKPAAARSEQLKNNSAQLDSLAPPCTIKQSMLALSSVADTDRKTLSTERNLKRKATQLDADSPALLESSHTTDSKLTASAQPKVAAIDQTKVATSAQSKVAISDQSKVATSAQSKVAAIGQPKVATSAQSKVAAIGKPKVATCDQSKLAAIGQPKVATSAQSKVATSAQSKVATSAQSKVATSDQSKVATSVQAKVATSAQSKVATSDQSKVATSAQSKVATSAQSKVATSVQSKVATSVQAKVATSVQAKVATSVQSKVATSVQSKVATSVQSKVATSAQSKVATSVQSKVTASVQLKVTASVQPKVTASVQPKVTASVQPKVTASVQPKVTASVQPKVTASVQPKVTASVQPKVTASVQPKVTASVQPKVTASVQPKMAVCDQIKSAAANAGGLDGQASNKPQLTASPVAEVDPTPQLSLKHQSVAEKTRLRYIVIDGSNLAMAHGNGKVFSCRGIQLCVDYFRQRGHTEITAFVPQWRTQTAIRPDYPISNQYLLNKLKGEGFLVFTPSRRVQGKNIVCYDDRFHLRLAATTEGVIVSNDNFRDLWQDVVAWREVIEKRLLMYSFVGDLFMVPDDPLGRNGPTLDQLLTKPLPFTYSKPQTANTNFQPPQQLRPLQQPQQLRPSQQSQQLQPLQQSQQSRLVQQSQQLRPLQQPQQSSSSSSVQQQQAHQRSNTVPSSQRVQNLQVSQQARQRPQSSNWSYQQLQSTQQSYQRLQVAQQSYQRLQSSQQSYQRLQSSQQSYQQLQSSQWSQSTQWPYQSYQWSRR